MLMKKRSLFVIEGYQCVWSGKRTRQKKHIALICIAVCAAVLLVGCAPIGYRNASAENESFSAEFFAMDTYMTITAYGDGDDVHDALKKAEAEINRLDRLWSVTSGESEISILNREKHAKVSPDTLEILKASQRISQETDGAFDITIYPIVKAWGFTKGTQRVPDEWELELIKSYVDSGRIEFAGQEVRLSGNSTELDLGAVAKGYSADKVAAILQENGISSAVVSLGGNVQTVGTKPDGSSWSIAIQHPQDINGYIGVLKAADKAVVTSGTYQRYFEYNGEIYHHLMNPATGRPADSGLLSVTVITEEGWIADALSTALFVMGKESAAEFWRNGLYEFEMLLIAENGEIFITDGLTGVFNPTDSDTKVNIIKR